MLIKDNSLQVGWWLVDAPALMWVTGRDCDELHWGLGRRCTGSPFWTSRNIIHFLIVPLFQGSWPSVYKDFIIWFPASVRLWATDKLFWWLPLKYGLEHSHFFSQVAGALSFCVGMGSWASPFMKAWVGTHSHSAEVESLQVARNTLFLSCTSCLSPSGKNHCCTCNSVWECRR